MTHHIKDLERRQRAWDVTIRAMIGDAPLWLPIADIEAYLTQFRHTQILWELVKPLKFPNRRRREDREIPKAA